MFQISLNPEVNNSSVDLWFEIAFHTVSQSISHKAESFVVKCLIYDGPVLEQERCLLQ